MNQIARYLIFSLFFLLPSISFAQGRIDCSTFNSEILHRAVHYCVMLPPGYETDKAKKYPVLYFLHGLGQNEQTLLRSGGWGLIEDLRLQHKIGDFLMVAPEGRGSFFINSADGRDRYSDFFLSEFLPYIETHYRVIRDRRSRGMTGLSMGGYGALRFAFGHSELFGSVSVQSPALITESPRELNADLQNGGPPSWPAGTKSRLRRRLSISTAGSKMISDFKRARRGCINNLPRRALRMSSIFIGAVTTWIIFSRIWAKLSNSIGTRSVQ
jgi:enterochelin esterase-like enzyme